MSDPIWKFTGTWVTSNDEQRKEVEINDAAECFHCGVNDLRVFNWRETGSLDWQVSFVFRNHAYRWDGPIFQEYQAAREHLEKLLVMAVILEFCDTTHARAMAEFFSVWGLRIVTGR
jgi:hypothetical protein